MILVLQCGTKATLPKPPGAKWCRCPPAVVWSHWSTLTLWSVTDSIPTLPSCRGLAFLTSALHPDAALLEMGFGALQLSLVALGDADPLERRQFYFSPFYS